METTAPETIKELIRKVHTLSVRGVGGEAEAAKRKLETLLAKHQLSLEDVVSDSVKTYDFRYKTELERQLIVQCYVSLGAGQGSYGYKKAGRKVQVIGFDLTSAQYIDLKGMLDYYKVTLKKETDRLFMAFVQRHKLYAPSSGEETAEPMSLEELEHLVAMMRGLGEKSYFKPAGLLA